MLMISVLVAMAVGTQPTLDLRCDGGECIVEASGFPEDIVACQLFLLSSPPKHVEGGDGRCGTESEISEGYFDAYLDGEHDIIVGVPLAGDTMPAGSIRIIATLSYAKPPVWNTDHSPVIRCTTLGGVAYEPELVETVTRCVCNR